MTTCDLGEAQQFASEIDAEMSLCDNGEGSVCTTLETTLLHYADLCRRMREEIRIWGRAVFSGRVAFDPRVEAVLLEEANKLCGKAVQYASYGEPRQSPCCTSNEQNALESALAALRQLLVPWVSPQLSVSPSARNGLGSDPGTLEYAKQALKSLPPLPADWKPDHRIQDKMFRLFRKS